MTHPAHNQTLADIDRRGVIHPHTDLRAFAAGELGDPTIMTAGDGLHLVDSTGRRYLDAAAGLFCVNVGYGRREIAEAINAQASTLAWYHAHAGHASEAAIRLTDRVLRLCPAGMRAVFWGLQGSDAHDTIVKLIWYANNAIGRPAKKKIIARDRAYHGQTVMAASLSGLPAMHRAFDLPIGPVVRTSAPYAYRDAPPGMDERAYSARCADALDRVIVAEGPDTVAAFIAEPMMSSGGMLPPPAGYWEAIQAVLRRHDVMLVLDEVVTGFGRLGTWFGAQRYGLEPDFMSISKGLTSAYLPLAGSVVSERVWTMLEEGSRRFGPLAHGFTYVAHPVCAAAALANIDILEREDLPANAARMGVRLLDRLRARLGDHAFVGDIRGDGLLVGVEFVADRAARRRFDPDLAVGRRIVAAARANGLILRALPDSDTVAITPPLTVSAAEIDEIVDGLGRALGVVADALPPGA